MIEFNYISSIALLGHESKQRRHPIHISYENLSLIDSSKYRASVGHNERHAPQSIHLSSSMITLPFLFTTTLFCVNASVIILILSSGISSNKLAPLDPVVNFKILKVMLYFKISFIIFE